MTECRYCGNAHDVRELCHARRVSRRKFLFAAGATVAAVAVAPLVPKPYTVERTWHWGTFEYPDSPVIIADKGTMDTYVGLLMGDDDGTWRSPYLGFDRTAGIPRIIEGPTYQDVEREDFRF